MKLRTLFILCFVMLCYSAYDNYTQYQISKVDISGKLLDKWVETGRSSYYAGMFDFGPDGIQEINLGAYRHRQMVVGKSYIFSMGYTPLMGIVGRAYKPEVAGQTGTFAGILTLMGTALGLFGMCVCVHQYICIGTKFNDVISD